MNRTQNQHGGPHVTRITLASLVPHTCSYSTWEVRQEGHEFAASLGYAVRLCLKIKIIFNVNFLKPPGEKQDDRIHWATWSNQDPQAWLQRWWCRWAERQTWKTMKHSSTERTLSTLSSYRERKRDSSGKMSILPKGEAFKMYRHQTTQTQNT